MTRLRVDVILSAAKDLYVSFIATLRYTMRHIFTDTLFLSDRFSPLPLLPISAGIPAQTV